MEETVFQLKLVAAAAWSRQVALDHADICTGNLILTCKEAYVAGVQKQQIAEAAGITRATLDRWLKKKL